MRPCSENRPSPSRLCKPGQHPRQFGLNVVTAQQRPTATVQPQLSDEGSEPVADLAENRQGGLVARDVSGIAEGGRREHWQ
ncbi:hypothetical protein GCM10010191_03670 [Actinomadura vinacea]|uniref:Uncharacterized protein n=1 Tax=Actinomadura vinacea TaxID=115336 RepID=A0ABP5VHU1_9ACTN